MKGFVDVHAAKICMLKTQIVHCACANRGRKIVLLGKLLKTVLSLFKLFSRLVKVKNKIGQLSHNMTDNEGTTETCNGSPHRPRDSKWDNFARSN